MEAGETAVPVPIPKQLTVATPLSFQRLTSFLLLLLLPGEYVPLSESNVVLCRGANVGELCGNTSLWLRSKFKCYIQVRVEVRVKTGAV